jgi:hypothetical protein
MWTVSLEGGKVTVSNLDSNVILITVHKPCFTDHCLYFKQRSVFLVVFEANVSVPITTLNVSAVYNDLSVVLGTETEGKNLTFF